MMDIMQAINERHSVRAYKEKAIENDVREKLDAIVKEINEESGLHIVIKYDDPEGFDSKLAHYGSFRNVSNYIILAGNKNEDIDEKCGYYGEKLVLEAQRLGLNTCWAALTFNKKMVKKLIPAGEKLCMVIALGYGENQGVPHKGKSLADIGVDAKTMPENVVRGAEAALLAPTAVNQQKFKIQLVNDQPVISIAGFGFNTKVDLGIVKYHFDAAQ